MRFILEFRGRVTIESRRESFYIHIDYSGDHPLGPLWTDFPHPEIEYEDLPDLITALKN